MSDSFAPATGGTERVVEALAKGLTARGHPNVVATLGRPDAPAHQFDGDIEVRRIDGLTRYLRRFASDPNHYFHPTCPDPLLVGRLQALVDEIRPDIVHAHGWILNSCLSLRLGDAALVATLHDFGLTCAKKTLIHRDTLDGPCPGTELARCLRCSAEFYGVLKGVPIALALRESRRRADRVALYLPISDTVEAASLRAVPKERIEQIPSFIDDSAFHEARSTPRPSFLPDGPFIVYVGVFGEHKGPGLLVAAHQRMRTPIPLVMIGSERADTEPYEGTTDRPIFVHTKVSHDQIMASLAAASVAVVPSRWQEPLGLVAVEAMAAGTAVVATWVGALAQVVSHGRTGLIVPPNDPVAMARAIDRLLDDPGFAANLASEGVRRAREYAASTVIPRVVEAYRKALAARPAG
ncbi:glycosyltransferase family 4 protein [Mycobacterium sp. PDNC021]|uniref:glycosyltransferase family 4 protein n=1 Tax=Mycobacterium sp. PDNC021 TaxID=3391399 RepID=UPI003AAA9518